MENLAEGKIFDEILTGMSGTGYIPFDVIEKYDSETQQEIIARILQLHHYQLFSAVGIIERLLVKYGYLTTTLVNHFLQQSYTLAACGLDILLCRGMYLETLESLAEIITIALEQTETMNEQQIRIAEKCMVTDSESVNYLESKLCRGDELSDSQWRILHTMAQNGRCHPLMSAIVNEKLARAYQYVTRPDGQFYAFEISRSLPVTWALEGGRIRAGYIVSCAPEVAARLIIDREAYLINIKLQRINWPISDYLPRDLWEHGEGEECPMELTLKHCPDYAYCAKSPPPDFRLIEHPHVKIPKYWKFWHEWGNRQNLRRTMGRLRRDLAMILLRPAGERAPPLLRECGAFVIRDVVNLLTAT